ncbi:MAG: type II toxin-antitoxin system VapC family toxin [Gammaproteobacteria bacterium]|uniref:type II toxin-antitoxin system VapC family toxin n=1 Tax=Rhodoferax sp. TaxID=50421 RepID=UPI00182B58CD|nr:type II toxin-antitoxin system VapC family toxin [Rhodoferax sp.]MBU3898361.1 type II toxin-antitoxin system VapC family toxin [Gammaproteobacteria bacterium]MBA3059375.1 type II toxin-antitoxin system VapC family toxin [Rhodoferax sp.]MBU3996963.1 type II toxin-antitoxin system VapC family toxin [Gammaproteobacteria bacterium]MBU4019602.1 type II toxin-antitoxin system VapC family toxin [Gammaproteobacteria bacterium]MBU4079135.1 type II toxin-antitoxin system VapC family toxin [Gammaprote
MSALIILADTNVISEFVKKTPDAQVMQWLQSVQQLAISVITLEEAHFGLAWQPNARKLMLFDALVQRLHAVYPITPAIAERAGVLRGQFQAQGIIRSTPDMLIAATAVEHQLAVATRNVRDFLGCGVQIVNPFEFS